MFILGGLPGALDCPRRLSIVALLQSCGGLTYGELSSVTDVSIGCLGSNSLEWTLKVGDAEPRATADVVVPCLCCCCGGTGAKTISVSYHQVLVSTWSLSLNTTRLRGWSWRERIHDDTASLHCRGASITGTPGDKDCSRRHSCVASESLNPNSCR